MVTRREFVRASTLGGLGLWLSGCDDPVAPDLSPGTLRGRRPSKRVAVVGAGIAGLVAAYELSRAGHDVVVFEARDRVGGRVLTLRGPFAPGHFAEAGAARIRPEHDLTLGYLHHFGLAADPFYPDDGLYLEVSGGRRVEVQPSNFRSRRPPYVKIRGGTELLPLSFAGRLGSIHLATTVAAVRRTSAGVRIELDDGSRFEADRAVVTVPLPVLNRIVFEPPLSIGKQEAAAGGFGYRAATRVFVRFARRFWEGEGLNGWGETDWPEELWHPTWDLEGPAGVLLTYVRGDRARELDALTEDDRRRTVLDHWEEFLPGVTAEASTAITHSWQAEEWSGAAWAAPTPTQDAQLSAELERPEGPLHFAGEHASPHRGWMQGALFSGIRAAREIHEA